MLVDVTEVKFKKDYCLWLKFEDGTEGDVDVKDLLGDFSGIFTKFSDMTYFKSVRVNPEIGTISWSEDIDICPDILYAAVKGLPKPDLTSSWPESVND